MYAYRTPGVYFEWLDESAPRARLPRSDVAGFLGFAERGPLHRPVRIISTQQFRAIFGGHIAEGYLAYAVEGFFENGGKVCWIVRIDVPEQTRTASVVVASLSGLDRLQLVATSPGRWANRLRVSAVGDDWQTFSIFVRAPDGTEQIIRNPARDLQVLAARADPDAHADPDTRAAAFERADVDFDLLVHVRPAPANVPAALVVGNRSQQQTALAGGADALDRVTPVDFTGDTDPPPLDDADLRGLAALAKIDEVALVAMPDIMPKPVLQSVGRPPLDCKVICPPPGPDYSPPIPMQPPSFDCAQIRSLQIALVQHCRSLRDRFAILDMPKSDALPEHAADWRRRFSHEESFGALYYPWIAVNDPLELDGLVRRLPPSGHLAGVFARTDLTQGLHQAPANEIVEGARDLTATVTAAEHGDLNSIGVNVIVRWPAGGLRVYGARTLYQAPLLRYINVRRLLLAIEEGIDESTQWITFEPHDDSLRRATDRVVRSMLDELFQRGMLDGATQEEAYTVQCDRRNNPPEEVDAGRLICDVGVRPPYPAEFVVVRIGRTQSGIEVLEERSLGNA